MSGPHETSGADAPVRMGDLEALFQRFSLQQEERHQEVRECTQGLEARLISLEHRSHAPSFDSFDGAVETGGTNRVLRPRPAGGLPPSAPIEEEENADDEADDSKKKKPKYHTAIQRYTTMRFRGECGVQRPDWPETAVVRVNPATGVKYHRTVDKGMKDKRPPGVPETAVWNSRLLLKCAKQSFRTCKASWKKAHDAEAAKRAAVNERNTRRYRRRCTKYAHIETQIDAYAAKLRVPPSVMKDLLSQELLSDEASGPEDEAEEAFYASKVRMAAAAGRKNLTAAALKNEHFVEVFECPWRSDELSIISSSMQTLYTTALNASGGAPIKYTRVSTPTHRKSSRIPRISPWDFGISSQWLEEQRNNPEVSSSLWDWGNHGNPKGCKWEDVHCSY
ncbi:hypothetical protein MVEN_01437800 [Mycena venus]|uniref:Uncharacterized protein n=1 Tax=Mycena venus TaxID=2733690 RepID=A0A8H6XVU8_9AGAR|nr:hypothetical protein MVEN_01437800 [Mycena venus]